LTNCGQRIACPLYSRFSVMNSNRILAISFVLVFASTVGSAFSQEAVEPGTSTNIAEKAFTEKPDKNAPEIKSGRSIQELMTPEEFKAAGLDKLDESELEHLDAWLQGYRQTTEKRVSAAAEKRVNEEVKKATEEATAKTARTKLDSLVSRVDGSFLGLTGKTLIKLEDGTVWKQANKEDRYRGPVTDHPLVAVSHSAFGYKMRIEGTPEFYVNPVRNTK
jgi:hypothetical protein